MLPFPVQISRGCSESFQCTERSVIHSEPGKSVVGWTKASACVLIPTTEINPGPPSFRKNSTGVPSQNFGTQYTTIHTITESNTGHFAYN